MIREAMRGKGMVALGRLVLSKRERVPHVRCRARTVTAVSDGFDWQGATYPSLSAIARAITGTAWSGPRFFALARGNGAPARRNKNASAREGRDGSQPARGMNASEMNTASSPLQPASHA